MNVGELIDRVRLEIHNDLKDEQIIGRFNELTGQIFRKLKFPEKIYGFMTTEIPYYVFPPDCAEDGIRCVVIDGNDYVKVNPQAHEKPPYFCTAFLDTLFISPNTPGKEAFLYYRARPIKLVNLEDVPTIPEDYHTLYIYDAAQWIAGIQRDVDMKNNFYNEYSTILRDIERDLSKMGMKTVTITTRWDC